MKNSRKFILFIWLSMVFVADTIAQNVVWNNDGSVTVGSDEEVFYSYIPAKFDDSFLMPHLDFGYFFKQMDNSWFTDHRGGIKNTADSYSSTYAKFEIYTYDPDTSNKIGSFIYGCESNGQHPNDFTEIYYERDRTRWLSSSSSKTSSLNIKYWASEAKISIPNECLATHNTDTRIVGYVCYGLQLAADVGFGYMTGGVYAALKNGLIITMIESGLINSGFHIGDDKVFCDRYRGPIQPVILKIIAKNTTIKALKIAGIPSEIIPSKIFNRDSKRWNNTNFNNLFRDDDKVTIAAHRGYWRKTGVAQNSIAALNEAANKSDADMIELDLRSTKDSVPICFHDDLPQKILKQTATTFPRKSIYDLDWVTLKDFYLYDRHENQTTEKLLNLNTAFKYYADNNLKKPINLDIGIPAKVPQNGGKVPGQPFFDKVFLKAVGLAAKYNITDRIIFKGKYTIDNPIWEKVKDTLQKYEITRGNGFKYNPTIAYTPKFGDDTGLGTPKPKAYRAAYLNNWLNVSNRIGKPFINVVGMEVRLKNDEDNNVNSQLLAAIPMIRANKYSEKQNFKVGVFSETPSTCQGYWTKSAKEHYIDFTVEKRNNFDWILNKDYDYIITDFPNILNRLRTARSR